MPRGAALFETKKEAEIADPFLDRQQLFDDLAVEISNLGTSPILHQLIRRDILVVLFSHNPQDAIDFLEQHPSPKILVSNELWAALRFGTDNTQIRLKQPAFIQAVRIALRTATDEGLLRNVAIDPNSMQEALEPLSKRERESYVNAHYHDPTPPVIARINAYYARFLEHRKIKTHFDDPSNKLSSGEDIAQQIIHEYAQLYRGDIFTGMAVRLIADELKDEFPITDEECTIDGVKIKKEDVLEHKVWNFLRETLRRDELDLLSQETLTMEQYEKLLHALEGILRPDQLRRIGQRYRETRVRPLRQLTAAHQGFAQKELIAEIKASLKARGVPDQAYDIERNPKTGDYEIKWKTPEHQTAARAYEFKQFPRPESGDFDERWEVTEYGLTGFERNGGTWAIRYLDGSISLVPIENFDPMLPLRFLKSRRACVYYDVAQGALRLKKKNDQDIILAKTRQYRYFSMEELPDIDGAIRYLKLRASEQSEGLLFDLETNKVLLNTANNTELRNHRMKESPKGFIYTADLRDVRQFVIDAKENPTAQHTKKFFHPPGTILEVLHTDPSRSDRPLFLCGKDDGDLYIFEGCEYVDGARRGYQQFFAREELYKFMKGCLFVGVIYDKGVPVVVTKNGRDLNYSVIGPSGLSDVEDIEIGPLSKIRGMSPISACSVDVKEGKLAAIAYSRSDVSSVTWDANQSLVEHASDVYYKRDDLTFSAFYRNGHFIVTPPNGTTKRIEAHYSHGSNPLCYFEPIGNSVAFIVHDDLGERLAAVFNPVSKSDVSDAEQHKLDLLNTALHPTRERIMALSEKLWPQKTETHDERRERVAQELSKNRGFLRGIQGLIRSAAKDLPLAHQLFKTMPAQPVGNDVQLAQRVVDMMFPEIALARARRAHTGDKHQQPITPRVDFDFSEYGELLGADPDPHARKSQQEVVTFRDHVHGFLATRIFSEFDAAQNVWRVPRQPFEIAPQLDEPVMETSGTITVSRSGVHVLPIPVGAEIIPGRVKAFDTTGRELATLQPQEKGGVVCIDAPRGAHTIVFSIRYSTASFVPHDVSQQEYEALHRTWTRTRAAAMEHQAPEPIIAQLPPECKYFVNQIQDVPPVERLKKIEAFVREHGYYDFDNGSVQEVKRGLSPTELFACMRGRMAQIKRMDPKRAPMLEKKYFAGVCSDFNILVATLCQASGFVGGVMVGAQASGTRVTNGNAHAVAWVAWPPLRDEKHTIVTIDGTPAGVTAEEEKLLREMRTQTLDERQKASAHALQEFDEAHAAEFAEIARALAAQDVDAIRDLTNGDIERAVNAVIKKETKQKDARVLTHVLNVLLYSPVSLDRFDWSDIRARADVLGFVDEELTRERLRHRDERMPEKKAPGTQLMDAFLTFIDRYHRRYPQQTSAQMFDLLDHVFDGIHAHLEPAEQRSAAVIITYLRAKQMVKPTLAK